MIPLKAKFCPGCGSPVIQPKEKNQIPAILKANEAMEFLRISRSLFYQLLSRPNDPIPFFPMGSRKRFITDELLAWAKRNQTQLRTG